MSGDVELGQTDFGSVCASRRAALRRCQKSSGGSAFPSQMCLFCWPWALTLACWKGLRLKNLRRESLRHFDVTRIARLLKRNTNCSLVERGLPVFIIPAKQVGWTIVRKRSRRRTDKTARTYLRTKRFLASPNIDIGFMKIAVMIGSIGCILRVIMGLSLVVLAHQ